MPIEANAAPPTPTMEATTDSPFCHQTAAKSLRVTCYGSSSSKTPQRYLKEARQLGYILAKRGHVCVNGAGQFGCMAAMNEGVELGEGSVVGVIHEMFLVDNGYWQTQGKNNDHKTNNNNKKTAVIMRDGGAHHVFANATMRHKDDDNILATTTHLPEQQQPTRELLVAGGRDLQERKKLLVRGADGLVVLPGGPGTWDELWEMACARHLNLNPLPIVCVNVDGFYEPFRTMLQQAWSDELIKLPPEDIVHFAPSAEEAVRWIETEKGRQDCIEDDVPAASSTATESSSQRTISSRRNNISFLQKSSFFSASSYQNAGRTSFFSWPSTVSEERIGDETNSIVAARTSSSTTFVPWVLTFASGAALGALLSLTLVNKR